MSIKQDTRGRCGCWPLAASVWGLFLTTWYVVISNGSFGNLATFGQLQGQAKFQMVCNMVTIICGLAYVNLRLFWGTENLEPRKKAAASEESLTLKDDTDSQTTQPASTSKLIHPNIAYVVLSWTAAVATIITIYFDTSVVIGLRQYRGQIDFEDPSYKFYQFSAPHYWCGWLGITCYIVTPFLDCGGWLGRWRQHEE